MTSKTYKLLVVDIDGTLLGEKGTISTQDRIAIAKAGELGIQVSLSTGRVIQSSLWVIDQLALEGYHIFFDGALVSNPKNGYEIHAKSISKELVRQAVEFAHLNEITLDFYSTTHYFIEQETWGSDIRRDFYGTPPTVVDITGIWQTERIIKATMTVKSPEEKAKADSFCQHFEDSLSYSLTKTPAYPEVDFINVLAPNVSKGEALEILISFLGISLTEVMAIGDGINDVSVLSRVALAVAMADAPDELKATADYLTLDAEHDGVAVAIQKLLL